MENIITNLGIIATNDVNDILQLYPEADADRKVKIEKDVLKDIEDAKNGDRIIYGAKLNGEVVGTIQLIFKMEKDYYADGKTKAHLHHTRVLKELQGRGIGSQLVKIAEYEACKRKFKEITLGVEETNIEAIKFYEKLGYKKFMREKGDEGEVIMGMKKNWTDPRNLDSNH
jgi:ribosomal protein S18 acetylase RimI-like enzyme